MIIAEPGWEATTRKQNADPVAGGRTMIVRANGEPREILEGSMVTGQKQ